MSDCSTAAMLPKEQPRTCGTCEHLARARDPKAASMSDHICLHMVTYVNDPNRPNCGGTRYSPRSAPQEAGQLEQRCQQLEQMAREMWQFFHLVSDDLGIEVSFTHGATGKVWSLPKFREQLEALGVTVDAD